jgi:hypothetical protein
MAQTLPDSDPDISCGLLNIWVLGRQFPEANDYWDGNWLRIVAHCAGEGAFVTVTGPIIHLREIAAWRRELVKMNELVGGTAELPTLEPNLRLALACDRRGHVQVECQITPDHMAQSHSFSFEIDQTYLGGVICACDRVLEEYPIRDPDQTARA